MSQVFIRNAINILMILNSVFFLFIIFDSQPPAQYDLQKKEIETLQQIKTHSLQSVETESLCEESDNEVPDHDAKKYIFDSMFEMFNPFKLLGNYNPLAKKYLNTYPQGTSNYQGLMYGLHHEANYCDEADLYNLNHPQNFMNHITFFTDYSQNGILRRDVMNKIGSDPMKDISRYMSSDVYNSEKFYLDRSINMFFTKRVDMHLQFEMGKNFGCATQIYNHIPGHGVMKRKDLLVGTINDYSKKYEDRPQCFDSSKFFAPSFRLWIKEECQNFFKDINSESYKQRIITEPIQYIIKLGAAAHQGLGVFLLDDEETTKLKTTYGNFGEKCGTNSQSLVAQIYINNPLLLDRHNKFDFRVYMLVASTNPLIVYYYDGLAKVNIQPYNKTNNDRAGHLTNTRFSELLFEKAKTELVYNMTEEELRQYQVWTFQRLQTYLLKVGKISNNNWVDEELRPAFMRGILHLSLMSEEGFLKQSNVFEMFGLDFMLDDELNLWFIECNSSPQYVPTNDFKTGFLTKMLTDMMEIMLSYYRSRMLRTYNLLLSFNSDVIEKNNYNLEKYQKDFNEVSKNRLDEKYPISKSNGFTIVIDKSMRNFGEIQKLIPQECF